MKHLFILIFLNVSIQVLFGQNITSLAPTLDSIATQDVPPGAPGVATGIVQNGKVIYTKVAGFADLTDSLLITENTRFNIASNGKQFTALAILLLEHEGKLRLGDDIRTYFPALYPNIKFPITIEHLLNHSSGIRDVYDLWALQGLTWWEHSFDNADALKLLAQQQELNFQPGTRYLYSNSNYILLAELIGKVSGKNFVNYTQDLFSKLNMPHTSFSADYKNITPPIAKPYFNFNTWTAYDWLWNVCGDGNLFTTLKDQLQWEKVLQNPGLTKIPKKVIQKSQTLTASNVIKNYGYGLEFGRYNGLKYTFHTGATGAWKAVFMRFPDKNISIVTMINTGKADPMMQTRQMADVILDLKNVTNKYPTQPATVGSYVTEKDLLGIYLNDASFRFEFLEKDQELYLRRPGRNDIKLLRESDNVFHQWNDPAFKQEFKRNANGDLEVTAYYTTHAPYTLTKRDYDWTNFNYQQLNGTYKNAETGATIAFQHLSDRQYQVKINAKESTGTLVAPNQLLLDFYKIDIPVQKDVIKEILLAGDRIQKVRFLRVE